MPSDASSTELLEREPIIAALSGGFSDDKLAESKRPLNILILDDPAEVELMARAPDKAGVYFAPKRVDPRADLIEALGAFAPDVGMLDIDARVQCHGSARRRYGST